MKFFYVTRMFFVAIAVLTTTTSISAMSLDDIDVETVVASESGRRIPRGVASVLSKLLFGGTNTFVTLQLGEVPPDHPLVKYPNPIQMTARKTNDKLLIALPLDKDTPSPTKSSSSQRRKDRNNAEKSDLETAASSHPEEDDDTPLSPMESAANTLSYTVLQDKYEPFIHKPPSVQKKRDPMKPASLHLPGLQYSEGPDGTVSVLPATPYTKILGEEALKATGTQVPDLSKPPTVPIPQPVVDLLTRAASTTKQPHVAGAKSNRIPAVVQTKTLRSDGTSSVSYTPIYISGGPFEWWRTQGLPPAPHKKFRGPARRKIPRHHHQHRRPQQTFKIHPHNMQPNQIHINSPSVAGSAAYTKQMYMTQ